MDIRTATSQAMAQNRYIARSDDWTAGRVKIRPTNTPDCCILISCGGQKNAGKRWQPQADDLMSDRWIVVD